MNEMAVMVKSTFDVAVAANGITVDAALMVPIGAFDGIEITFGICFLFSRTVPNVKIPSNPSV
jgi:hypothetical protein